MEGDVSWVHPAHADTAQSGWQLIEGSAPAALERVARPAQLRRMTCDITGTRAIAFVTGGLP